MAQTGSAREARLDLLLGKVALERGLVNAQHLREALAEQALGIARGRKKPRAIGAILAERKHLTDSQVADLTRELERVVAGEVEEKKNDVYLGQILIDADLVAAKHVDECLLAQAEMFERGIRPVPRIGEILVDRGFAAKEDVEQALLLQKSMVRTCSKCGKSCSLSGASAPDRCPICGGSLEQSLPPESLAAVSSTVIPVIPQEKTQADPQRLGKYLLDRVLGRGGCGVVYLAEDAELHRKVALKLMHRGSGSDSKESSHEVERFVREAQLSARLRHPNIVSIYEAGTIDGKHYIAMEYVEGTSMAQWRKGGSITIRQQVRVLRDVALAVHHAHQQGVTHRDLKPQNVLIDVKLKPYVTDFGLAKKAGGDDVSASLTVEGAILGTPAYMSPEQAKGRKTVGKRSDVWSLGVMLYELLTGRQPFRGETPIAILMKVLRDPVTPPSQAAPAILSAPLYRPLEAVVMRALEKEAGDRYASAKDFADDLTQWLKGDEVKGGARRSRRMPRWAIGAASALGVLGLLALAGLAFQGPRVSKNLVLGEEKLQAGEWDAARQYFEHVLAREPDNERARSGLALARAKIELEELRAKGTPAAAPVGPSRTPDRWLVIGPFDNRGLDAVYPPETRIDLRQPVPATRGDVSWKPARAAISPAGAGTLDFVREFGPRENAVCYALVHVKSPIEAGARLFLGSDDGVKVWVNGEVVHANDVYRAMKPDQDEASCRLRSGWNRFLIKVTQGTMGWGLSLRISGVDGLEFEPSGELRGP
jgi:serine/threonine protein kinase/rubrerythrin